MVKNLRPQWSFYIWAYLRFVVLKYFSILIRLRRVLKIQNVNFVLKSTHAFSRFWVPKSWSKSPCSRFVRAVDLFTADPGSVSGCRMFLNCASLYDVVFEFIDLKIFSFSFIKKTNISGYFHSNIEIVSKCRRFSYLVTALFLLAARSIQTPIASSASKTLPLTL